MHPIENNDNRHFHRIHFAGKATLSCEGRTWDCEIIDLCLKGCLLRFEFPWEDDLEKIYTLSLPLSEDTLIKMELSASHIVDNQVGFKCEHIDIDSISELRRLLEFNLGNSDLLERDLLALSE